MRISPYFYAFFPPIPLHPADECGIIYFNPHGRAGAGAHPMSARTNKRGDVKKASLKIIATLPNARFDRCFRGSRENREIPSPMGFHACYSCRNVVRARTWDMQSAFDEGMRGQVMLPGQGNPRTGGNLRPEMVSPRASRPEQGIPRPSRAGASIRADARYCLSFGENYA